MLKMNYNILRKPAIFFSYLGVFFIAIIFFDVLGLFYRFYGRDILLNDPIFFLVLGITPLLFAPKYYLKAKDYERENPSDNSFTVDRRMCMSLIIIGILCITFFLFEIISM